MRQRVVPALAVLVVLGALVYAMVPYTVAGTVDCRGALRGAEPESDVPAGVIVGNPRRSCRDVGNSRLATAGVVGVAAVIVGVGGLLLPPEPDDLELAESGEPAEPEAPSATEPGSSPSQPVPASDPDAAEPEER